MAVILGLDPGSKCTGYGLISFDSSGFSCRHYGTIAIPSKLILPEKLLYLKNALQSVFCEFQPSIFVIEKIFLGKNVDSVFKLGHIRGVCLMLAQEQNCLVYEYAARKVKKMVTGSGAATKAHTAFVVKKFLSLSSDKEIPLDASDALALAISHCQQMVVDDKLRKQQ